MINEHTPGIDRRSGLSQRDLLREYVIPNRPVILTDAVQEWKALGKWTPAFFKERYGWIIKEIAGQHYTLGDQADRMLSSTPANPAPYPYNLEVGDYFPELMEDLSPQLVFGKSDRALHPLMPKALMNGTPIHEVFFGGHGSSFPFVHYDALQLHTQITQIYGEKEIILYHPDDSAYMYPRKDNPKFSQVTDVFRPDLEKFPLFAHATPYRDVLRPGDTIYFPRGWWHTTMMYGPSITYGRIVLNASNYNAYLNDKRERWSRSGKLKAGVAMGVGRTVGALMSALETLK